MAIETIDCPHCRQTRKMESASETEMGSDSAYFLFTCPSCSLPIVILAECVKRTHEYGMAGYVGRAGMSFRKCGWEIMEIWPKPDFQGGDSPQGAPEALAKLFQQSQEAASKGGYDLAVMGFNRILKMAQKIYSPDNRSTPDAWITWLVENRHLTADMRDWADRIKGLRRDVEIATVKQTEEFAVFVHVLLEHLFGTRSRIAAFRKGANSSSP